MKKVLRTFKIKCFILKLKMYDAMLVMTFFREVG